MRRTTLVSLTALAALSGSLALPLATAGTAGHQTPAAKPHKPTRYDVKITRTAGGIPHIVGKNFGDVGYGYGFVFAKDNLCTMAADYVTVRGQRSLYFGPDGSYTQRGNGVAPSNLDSDIFWTGIKDSGVVTKLASRPAPYGPEKALKAGVRGYVAGYNRYLRSIGGRNGVKDPACHGKPWVRPITVGDAYLRFYQLVLLASQDVVIPGIAHAAPPVPGSATPASPNADPKRAARLLAEGWHRAMGGLGSNAVAVGKAGARDHKHGVLLGNPHFPWVDTERFYDAQITVPGVVDVTGASLFGVPLVLIGHNKTMAWSHTVSTAFRFTPYQLSLVPGDPTSYLQDGKPVKMTTRTVKVVETKDGKRDTVTHTLYYTRYGPVFDSIEGIPLNWTTNVAFAMRDANADNFRVFNHFYETDKAKSAKAELKVLEKYEGIPWVNTIVADKGGHALYADIGAIPNVSNALASKCNTALGRATTALLGLPFLDGSRKACDWGTDKDAVEPGLFGPKHLPHLFRGDYVTNSNDSYWLSNPHHPLEGFARIIGTERTARTLRTRVGLIMTQTRVNGTDGLGPKGFTLKNMTNQVFSNRQYAGELTAKTLAAYCTSLGGTAMSSNGPVSTGDACTVLKMWDRHENAKSKGAVLFRRFWDHLAGGPEATADGATGEVPYWSNQFDASNPVRTPNTLNTSEPKVQQALGDAIADLDAAHYKYGVELDKVQGIHKNGTFIPIQGGPGDPNGEFDAIEAPWVDGKGLADVDFGSSFVQAVTWHSHAACPDARTILTYSESTDPTNAHFADQTKRFSTKNWEVDRFCASAIKAHRVGKVLHLVGT